jgi:hypothetical protein
MSLVRRIARSVFSKLRTLSCAVSDCTRPTVAHRVVPDASACGFSLSFPANNEEPDGPSFGAYTQTVIEHRLELFGSEPGLAAPNASGRGSHRSTWPSMSGRRGHDGERQITRINLMNRPEAQRIWRLIERPYSPIDWHVDFKSGYRWPVTRPSGLIRVGRPRGADIKVPWELARMQHLPQLAIAHVVAESGDTELTSPAIYAKEFRNQILDFIANNPPRFGVNWVCTMDVAIRAANWIVADAIFRGAGARFDAEFERVFVRSIYEHGRFTINHLEWSPAFRGNHYLANIVGLLFVAAFLPRSSETDAWLAFAVQELIEEVGVQFHDDGANFEASTCYHRLSSEMVLYGTALVLGLSENKRLALKQYDHRWKRGRPGLQLGPMPHYDDAQMPFPVPFPAWYWDRVRRMPEFIQAVTRPDGRVVQVGDNDSGRFLKLDLATRSAIVQSVDVGRQGRQAVQEDPLDHRSTLRAFGAMLGADRGANPQQAGLEAALVRELAAGIRVPVIRDAPQHPSPPGESIIVQRFPDFGLYIYRTPRVYLAVRCGQVGQNGRGGHAHNDQLSIELCLDGMPFVVDPGTYVYTPAPDARNRFRSTAMHNTLSIPGREQNPWTRGLRGLFRLDDRARAEVVQCDEGQFIGQHHGFDAVHRRTVSIHESGITGRDECDAGAVKTVHFHLDPGVSVELHGDTARLTSAGVCATLRATDGATAEVRPSEYSPGYGIRQETQQICLIGDASRICWSIEVLDGRSSG